MTKRIVVVTGEPSGDLLGAQLADELRKIHPNMEIEGVIGAEMINAGCLQLHSMDTLAVMGLVEPVLNLHKILRLRNWLINYILQDPPDLFIGIDSPDFNLSVEKVLRQKGIPTVHYVSPSVWAWRQGRIKTIKKAVDLMLTLFPFEEKFYREHDVPVCFTGHPLADKIPFVTDKAAGKIALGFDPADKVVAIFPGSRNSEMKRMVPLYLQVMQACLHVQPNLKFVMPLVQPAYEYFVEHWKNKIAPELDLKYVIRNSHAVMRSADIALATSGTVTLELMLHKVPMLVAYKTDWFTYHIVKRLIKTKYIALPNLLADKPVVTEYIQQSASVAALSQGLLDLIDDLNLQFKQVDEFNILHKELTQSASATAARAINELL